MSDEKDPVREQIERDSEQWRKMPTAPAREYPVNFNNIDDIKDAHIVGRLDQDPIAWNRCLDAVIGIVRNSDNVFEALELLEKLRR